MSTLRWGPGMTAFAAEAVVEMVPQAGWRRVRVDAVRPGAGAAGANLRTVREGWLYFPPAVETLGYDLNGNLISDARWTYGWDGEPSRGTEARWIADFGGCPGGVRARVERPNQNRLIWMEEKVIPGGGIRPARQRLEFGYDGQSRRVVKRVLQKVSETSSWSLRQERRFLYDGWNMNAESSRGTEARWTDGTAGCPGGVRARAERSNQLDVPSSGAARVHRAYAWGLDASGTLTGAGGVGGLLLTSHHTPQAGGGTQVTTLAPMYDFNGNVLAYADVATSTITHRMEYDPFGQELSLDTLLPGESAVEAPRFRFSTKYTDGETGLVYYGYRSYSPELGRWVNRDPIEERGGINLYGMVGNDPANTFDRDGRNYGYVFASIAATCALPYVVAAHLMFGDSDKFKHCWVSCMIARQCGTSTSVAAGVVKELRDLLAGGGYDESLADMAANTSGYKCAGGECALTQLGGSFNLASVTRWFRKSCEECCLLDAGYQ